MNSGSEGQVLREHSKGCIELTGGLQGLPGWPVLHLAPLWVPFVQDIQRFHEYLQELHVYLGTYLSYWQGIHTGTFRTP